ncbi:hypothetical protein HBB16_05970 [Pseudonocardia sp. MCCB 268]|nr:hypothetical protein [Pseudonocardia cytotoxica]
MAAIGDQTRRPSPGGLYAADHEHDACGVAMLADVTGKRDHAIVQKAIRGTAEIGTPWCAAPSTTPVTAPGS